MGRNRTKLTAAKIGKLEPGMHSVGDTLYVVVRPGGSKSWLQRLAVRGKQTDIGLGSLELVTLDEARDAAFENRRMARRGGDPLAEKRKADTPTFSEAVEKTLDGRRARWRNAKTEKIWRGILARYVTPKIGNKPVDAVTREDVLRILTPIWTQVPESAKRCRQFMRTVFQWAWAHGYVDANPAGEALDGALVSMPAVKNNYRALPYSEVTTALRLVDNTGASVAAKLCLRLLVLTAVRSGEARGARWDEIDMDAATWTIPAYRMKMAKVHVVPLARAALDVLKEAEVLRDDSGLVFPSPMRPGRALSNMTLTKLLRDTGLADRATVHGFRTSFRIWAEERTNTDFAVKEMCLAHVEKNAVVRAYMRSDLLDKRRPVMDRWAQYLTGGETAKVVSIGR